MPNQLVRSQDLESWLRRIKLARQDVADVVRIRLAWSFSKGVAGLIWFSSLKKQSLESIERENLCGIATPSELFSRLQAKKLGFRQNIFLILEMGM